MGRTDTEEYARWEDGFERGKEHMVDVLKKALELEEIDWDSYDILNDKLEELKKGGANE